MKILNLNLKEKNEIISECELINSSSLQSLKKQAQEDIVDFKWVNFEGNLRLVLKIELPCYEGPLSQEVYLIDFENMKHYFLDERMYQELVTKKNCTNNAEQFKSTGE